MKFYEEQFDENQWFASCRLLALALAHSLLGILLPLSVVPGNLAIWQNLLLIYISLGDSLRHPPLIWYCLVFCDIFYIMLHQQSYLFVQFNQRKWTFASSCYLRITFLDFVPCTFSTIAKKRSPWNNCFFSSGCLPGIEDRVVLSDLYNLFSQSWSKLTSVNNQVNINYK